MKKPKAYREKGIWKVYDGVDIHIINRHDIDDHFETQNCVFVKVDGKWILKQNKNKN